MMRTDGEDRGARVAGVACGLALLRACLSPKRVLWPLALFVPYAVFGEAIGNPWHLIGLIPLIALFSMPRLATLHRAGRRLGMPRIGNGTAWAIAMVVVATLCLAALDTLRLGVPLSLQGLRALYLLAAVVCVVMIRPLWGVAAIVLLTAVDVWADGQGGISTAARWLFAAFSLGSPRGVLWIGAVVLSGAAFWLWITYIRSPERAVSAKDLPIFMAYDRDHAHGVARNAIGPHTAVARNAYGPDRPVAAMRTWIGDGFAPIQVRTILKNALLLALLALALAAASLLVPPYRQALSGYVFCLVLIFPLSRAAVQLQQLYRLMSAHSGERAELALLPGWGDAVRAKRLLLRSTVVQIGIDGAWYALPVGLFLAAAGQLIGLSPREYLWIASLYIVIVTSAMLIALVIVSGDSTSKTPAMSLLLLLLLATIDIYALREHCAFSAGARWVLVLATASAFLVAVGALLREYRLRPNPFLPA